jgi:hypothetical protein
VTLRSPQNIPAAGKKYAGGFLLNRAGKIERLANDDLHRAQCAVNSSHQG